MPPSCAWGPRNHVPDSMNSRWITDWPSRTQLRWEFSRHPIRPSLSAVSFRVARCLEAATRRSSEVVHRGLVSAFYSVQGQQYRLSIASPTEKAHCERLG